jgi:uncharacterized tellurite resistance protein B-like protein
LPKGKLSTIAKPLGGIALAIIALIALIPFEGWIAIGLTAGLFASAYWLLRYVHNRRQQHQERLYADLPVVRSEVHESAASRRAAPIAAPATLKTAKQPAQPPMASPAQSAPRAASRPAERNLQEFAAIVPREEPARCRGEFKLPPAPKGFGNAQWLPAGTSISVAGVDLPGGLLYVGTRLVTPLMDNDPCLIDPSKPVASQGDYTESDMGYWPSYSSVSASARRAYLNWLAGGRSDAQANIGYVFLYFYGLERRAILDAATDDAAKADWPVIAQELRRLLAIYGERSGSFRSYAGSLLDWVSLASHPDKAYLQPVPTFPKWLELPTYIRVALGQAAVDRAPVPSALALAWVKLDPATCLRTPAVRCGDEFDRLFLLKYQAAFGEGMVLPRNRTKLKLVHRPASAGFRGYEELRLTFGDTPDVTVLTAPIRKLQQLAEEATKELESFSRYVGKNPDGRLALEGLLQLPATLWPQSAQQSLATLKSRMGGGMVSMSIQELLTSLDAKSVLTKDKTLALARALESLNIGIEPDVLAGAKLPRPDEKVVLFAVPPGEVVSRAVPGYRAAVLTLQLASAVAAADGEFNVKEMGHLRGEVQSWTHLTPNHIRRLLAHLRLLMTSPASLPALKSKLEPLDMTARETIARFMATVAQSDGTVSPAEVKLLEKVYKALGVDPRKVFSDVHAVATGAVSAPAPSETPVGAGFRLDPARIAALQKDTQAVSALLSAIFVEEAPVEPIAEEEATAPPRGLLGLDESHSSLARLLLSRPAWTKAELVDAVADLDLMFEGALEALNEAAFDHHDIPFIEGEDPVAVNPELLEKLEA